MAIKVTQISFNNNILSTEEASLVSTKDLIRNFGASEDFIEMHILDPLNNLVYSVVPFKNYQIPGNLQSAGYPTINELIFTPDIDLNNLGIQVGDYKVQYNILRPKVNLTSDRTFFIKEISDNRQEIRLSTNNITNTQIENGTVSFINEIQGLSYFKEFYINLGNNVLLPAINIALDKNTSPYSILIKLLDPLPSQYTTLQLVSIVDEISNPQVFEVNIEPDAIPVTFPTLRSPNFNIELDQHRIGSTPYYNINNIYNSFTTSVDLELQSALSQLSASGFEVNVDYTDYNNFIHFSSANYRLVNFKYKLNQIELFTSASASAVSSGVLSGQIEAAKQQSAINKVIQSFDGYEYYLYSESGSYAWPKYNNIKPYINQSVTSSTSIAFFNSQSYSASVYDRNNQNYLINALPTYITDNTDNTQVITFTSVLGQVFDDIWIHIKSITDLYQAKNKLNEGISQELVYFALRSLGINLYTDKDQQDVFNYLYGTNTDGSYLPLTSSYQTLVSASSYTTPGKDQIESFYKRIYTNLPLLLKSKGTNRFIQYLNTIYGISNTIMSPIEFGGVDKVTSSFEYEYDRFTYALNLSGSNTVIIPWLFLSQSAARTTYNDIVADGIEFRFKASPSYLPTQSLFYSGSNFQLNLIYTNTGSANTIYNNTTGNFGYFKFNLGSSSVTSSIIPIFTTGSNGDTSWYNVLVQRRYPNYRLSSTGSQQYYDVYVKNHVHDQIGHAVSASLNTTTQNNYWYNQGILNFGGGSYPFSGSIQEIRLWSNYISESAFNFHVLNPSSIEGNITSSAFTDLAARFTLGNNLYTYNHYLTSSIASTHPDQNTQILYSTYSGFPNQNNYSSFIEKYYADVANSGYSNPVIDKVRIDNNTTYGYVLSPNLSIVNKPILPISKDIHLLETGLSPQNEINKDIIAELGSLYNIDNIIGNPSNDFSSSYFDLEMLQTTYFKKYNNKYNYKDFITLIEYFHNSLFKTLKDFIPARTNASTGITIKQHLLERSKITRHEPNIELKNNISTSVVTDFISSSNGGGYFSGYGDGSDFYKGELSGSYINYDAQWVTLNKNSFLDNFTTKTLYSCSIFNITSNPLLNNVSGGFTSSFLKKINYNPNTNTHITGGVEIQDFTYTYQRHIRPRYNGSKTTSTNYNSFLPDDLLFGLNKPYGKNPTIDHNTIQFAFFSEATCTGSQQIAMPERTNLYLRYLIDASGSLTDLTRRDYSTLSEQQHYDLYQVQNIFRTNDIANIALFDNQNPSRQKPIDGNHDVFQGGYRYYPTLWKLGETDELIYTLNSQVYPSGFSTGYATNIANYTITSVFYQQKVSGFFNFFTDRNVTVQYNPPTPGAFLPFDVIVRVRIGIVAGSDDYFDITIKRTNPDGSPNYVGTYGDATGGWRYNNGSNSIISVVPGPGYSLFTFDLPPDIAPYNNLIVNSTDTSIVSCSAQMSSYYNYGSSSGGWFFSGSAPDNYGNQFCAPEYPFQLNVGDLVRFASGSGNVNTVNFLPQEEYTIINVFPQTPTTNRVTFQLDRPVNPALTSSSAPYNIVRYVFSRKIPDETNIVMNVKKNPGQTSGGIVKNLNISKEVDDNIANVVSDLKSKIFSTVLIP